VVRQCERLILRRAIAPSAARDALPRTVSGARFRCAGVDARTRKRQAGRMPTPSIATPGHETNTTLLADLGGTNVRFALCDTACATPLRADSVRRYRVAAFASLADAARQYLHECHAQPRHALVAAAGRISDGQTVQITNNPWAVSARDLAQKLGLDSARLINDFAAQSMAVTLLRADEQAAIGALPPPVMGGAEQTFVVMGPGTGLGVGALLLRDGHASVLESEGGHAGFAPHEADDVAIAACLARRFDRVSNERLLSGQGLVNVHAALCEIAGQDVPEWQPEDITRRANAGEDALCVRTMEIVAGLFGAIAGDFVLTLGGWDGVYLTGGLLPVLTPWLQRGRFRERFEAKGRFAETLRHVPTVAITAAEPGLLGAAAVAQARRSHR
jgi:glucokinase